MPDIDPALLALVRSWGNGVCEYCRIPEAFTLAAHQIDHVIAVKHGGETVQENLSLCCSICNRFKGSDIASLDPDTRALTRLFHPRVDVWDQHFQVRDGEIQGLTATGRVTAGLLRMNRPDRIRERRLIQGQRS